MADNADALSKADQIACDVLVKEFEALHGRLPPDFPVGGSVAEQLRSLRRALDPGVAAAGQGRLQTALCLSGGGIRSATYCLGVLQGLAQRDQLGRFHYLSTVSGGGYVGSWLNGWIRRAGQDTVMRKLKESAVGGPAGAAPAPASPAAQPATAPAGRQPEPPELHQLRAYSNYLSPAVGLSDDMMALAAIFVRNLFLHWLVLIPLLALVLMLPRVALALLGAQDAAEPLRWGVLGLAIAGVVLAVAYMAADLPGPMPACVEGQPAPKPPKDQFRRYCLLPLALASSLFAWLAPWLGADGLGGARFVLYAVAGAAFHLAGAFFGMRWRKRRGLPKRPNAGTGPDLAIAVGIGAVGGAALLLVLCGLASWWGDVRLPAVTASLMDDREGYAVLAAPAVLGVFWLAVTLFAGLARARKTEDDREWWARAAGHWLLTALGWCVLAVAVLMLPQWLLSLAALAGTGGGASVTGGAALLGVASSAWGYWSRNREKITNTVKGLVNRLEARTLDLLSLAFIVLLAAALGLGLSATLAAKAPWLPWAPWADPLAADARCPAAAPGGTPPSFLVCARQQHQAATLPAAQQARVEFRAVLHGGSGGRLLGLMLLLGLAVWQLPKAIGVNTFSLHGMYGNRLIRAYLGASGDPRQRHWFTGFGPGDNLPLAEPAQSGQPGRRLFPVINAALNLVQASGGRLEWQQRKAASFTFTPLHCGSPALGYAPTEAYGRAPDKTSTAAGSAPAKGGVSIGRAMAISGAAASPNMGYHSSLPVAFAMSFFNVRLGWWMPNTAADFQQNWSRDEPAAVLQTVVAESLARTSEQTPFVYLSDGGHFENLGLYEMVRRRCRRILVVDATQDPDSRHEDLQQSIRKIRIDFGISVTFARGLPTAESCQRTAQPFALGTIHYGEADAGASDGLLLYLKPALWPGLPADLSGYAASNAKRGPRFPHQSTADQFFDEAQFESYRLLGLLSVQVAFGPTGLWPGLQDAPDHRPPPPAPAA